MIFEDVYKDYSFLTCNKRMSEDMALKFMLISELKQINHNLLGLIQK